MATEADIERLRRLIGEEEDTEPWTDLVLSDMIDDAPDLNTAALEVWESKMATAAGYVDTTESGSSRKMSQLQEQAARMVAHFRNLVTPPTAPPDLTGYAYTVGVERI